MLPGFPKLRARRIEDNAAFIQHVAKCTSPIIGEVKRHVQFEGAGNTIERYDDTVSATNMAPISAEFVIATHTPLAEFTQQRHQASLIDLGQQMARGASTHAYAELDKGLAAAGQVVDAGGRPMSEDLILEMMDKMHHDFTDDGQWIAPTIIGNAGAPQFAPSDSFNRRLGEILNRKRDDFRRREADRVLAG